MGRSGIKEIEMKFKDLKIGQRFTRVGWKSISKKIDEKNKNVKAGRVNMIEIDPPTGIKGGWLDDDADVIPVSERN